MTAEELIYSLNQLPPDAEVRFAGQPNWPFEYSITDVVVPDNPVDPDNPVAYIAEGEQLAYLPAHICELLGWR